MNSIARQYQVFVAKSDGETKGGKLLVSSISPGSIDISFLPEMAVIAAASVAPVADQIKVVNDFANHLKWLLDKFLPKPASSIPLSADPEVSVRDCDDAANIVKPIADNGGSQTFNTFNGVHAPVMILNIQVADARGVYENAKQMKHLLQFPQAETIRQVPMIWKRLDRDFAKSRGSTPDKGLIESLDPKPKPVFFAEGLLSLKAEMIGDEANPYQKIYFVDVDVSRVSEKVASYTIVAYHGKDDLEAENKPDDS